MAGLPWVKVATDFADHPKALELAHRLSDPRAPLYLPAMWGFFARFYGAGAMPNSVVSTRALERAVLWEGAPGRLVAAMVEVGLLERRDGVLAVHDWDEWQEGHARKIERDRARMREKRAEARENSRATGPATGRAGEERERREDDLPPTPPRKRGGTRVERIEAERVRRFVVAAIERVGLWLDRDGVDEPAVEALVAGGASGADVEVRLRALLRENPAARPADLVARWDDLGGDPPPSLAARGGA